MATDRRILFVTKQRQDASTRYRAAMYLPLLREAGFEAELLPVNEVSRFTLYRRVAAADVTVICRRTFGWLSRRWIRRWATKLVFDFDDAVFARPTGPSSTRAASFACIAERCDRIWAGNDYLAEHAAHYNRNVVVMPTALDTERYDQPHHPPDDTLDLVWIGGAATRPYLEAILPAIARARQTVANLRLIVIADVQLRHPTLPVVNVPWSSETEVAALARAHIGVAPLPDDPWTRGKCGFKILQYMASGLPVIAGDLPVHRQLLGEQAGLFAVSDEQWTEALIRLSRDAELRRVAGQAGRQRVLQRYSRNVIGRRIIDDIRRLCS